jgi:hypothetical protein
MLHRGALYLLIITLALLASPGLAPPVAAQATLVVDDTGPPFCAPVSSVYTTITQALAAASSGDTIHVCEGNYTEPSMVITTGYLTITGPGATPGDDGVATVHHNGVFSAMFTIQADGVVLQGLDLDATPLGGASSTAGFEIQGNDVDGVEIGYNEIRNATGTAVSASGGTSNVRIVSNNIHDSQDAVVCFYSDDCVVAGNTVNVTDRALEIVGDGANVTNNVFVNGRVVASGDNLFISTNQMTGAGPAVGFLLAVRGNYVSVVDNTLSDSTGSGIEVSPGGGSVTIARNTFTRIAKPIVLSSWGPINLAATIGGSQSEANTFVDSGGSLGDANYLVEMNGPTANVNAEYNKWGLCGLDAIEAEIYHQVDNSTSALVDFDPFIAPSGCSATPTPTPTPTATPSPTPTATATPGTTRTLEWGPGWHNAVWTGAASTPEEAFACAEGKYAAAYRLVNGGWERHFPNRLDISNMQDFEQYDAFFILVTQDTTCQMPLADPPGSLRTLDWGVGWNNDGWTGPDGTSPQDAFACAGGNYAAVYRLVSGGWERYFPDRPDISNMGPLNKYDAFLILVTAPVSCTMAVAL